MNFQQSVILSVLSSIALAAEEAKNPSGCAPAVMLMDSSRRSE
jgi:hypothetical protein